LCDIPPSIPGQPSGPVNGLIGTSYTYNASTTDPEEDDIVYCIDFGDDIGEVCVGPFLSGTYASVNHTWAEEGAYTVKVKATDIYGAESDWAALEVEMPVNQHSFKSLNLLFQRIIPILCL